MPAPDQPLRVALLAYRGKPHCGGQGVYVRHLSKALVDLGHHLPNTNIEQVVSRLAMVGRLGGFHFNDSKYGDDDLTVGSITPFQLYLIMLELLAAGDGRMPPLAYMIDESHNLKDPLEDLIQATDAIQQGAFRRGANMGILRVDHPDIVRFITFKDDRTKLTNYNISVAVTDRFLDRLQHEPTRVHEVQNPRTEQWQPLAKLGPDERPTGAYWTVGELWDLIVRHAHESGEPGVVFIDRINATNPIKNVGLIEATNPCGEQPLHPYDSCNLGSLNAGRLVVGEGPDARFDWDRFRDLIHTSTRFLDDVIEVNRYPLPQIDSMSKTTRRIGLGVMGFADALYRLGIPYDSEEACEFGERLMSFLQEESHLASEVLAEERGVFPAWDGSEWEERGRRLRNSYTTTIAPTGTISILADCSGGIEPMFSLVFQRQVMKDELGRPTIMREVNYVFEAAARERGYFSEELVDEVLERGTLRGVADVPEDHARVFVTAHDIAPEWHMRMQAAFQRHCDSSISKTINFPHDATVDDVRSIYDMAIDLGVKGVTVYRDGCRSMQPMALKNSEKSQPTAGAAPTAAATGLLTESGGGGGDLAPIKLPEIMSCLRIRQMTPFGNMHVKVSVDPVSGREREVFAQLGKGGDLANSDLEAICRILSLWLRSNGSLELALRQLSGIGSSLSVPTKDGRIMSLADGLAKALERYLAAKQAHGLEALLLGRVAPADLPATETGPPRGAAGNKDLTRYKLKCPSCGDVLAFQEGCVKCHACGFSQC